MAEIIHNKEELMEVVREAADAVFDAWFRVMEREEKKKREQKNQEQMEGIKKALRPGESVAQHYNRIFREMGCKDPFPGCGVFEESQSASSLPGEGDE